MAAGSCSPPITLVLCSASSKNIRRWTPARAEVEFSGRPAKQIPSLPEKKMIKGFRDFILRGNVVDLAIAVVIGAAFTAIVNSLVANIINPLIAAIVQKPD